MDVEVRLFATLREGRTARQQCTLPPNSNLRDVVQLLHLASDEIGLILVNGQHRTLDSLLQAGDIVSLFPHIGGG